MNKVLSALLNIFIIVLVSSCTSTDKEGNDKSTVSGLKDNKQNPYANSDSATPTKLSTNNPFNKKNPAIKKSKDKTWDEIMDSEPGDPSNFVNVENKISKYKVQIEWDTLKGYSYQIKESLIDSKSTLALYGAIIDVDKLNNKYYLLVKPLKEKSKYSKVILEINKKQIAQVKEEQVKLDSLIDKFGMQWWREGEIPKSKTGYFFFRANDVYNDESRPDFKIVKGILIDFEINRKPEPAF